MSITTLATWLMIAIIFWLALYMIGGWPAVFAVAGASVLAMAAFLWSDR